MRKKPKNPVKYRFPSKIDREIEYEHSVLDRYPLLEGETYDQWSRRMNETLPGGYGNW